MKTSNKRPTAREQTSASRETRSSSQPATRGLSRRVDSKSRHPKGVSTRSTGKPAGKQTKTVGKVLAQKKPLLKMATASPKAATKPPAKVVSNKKPPQPVEIEKMSKPSPATPSPPATPNKVSITVKSASRVDDRASKKSSTSAQLTTTAVKASSVEPKDPATRGRTTLRSIGTLSLKTDTSKNTTAISKNSPLVSSVKENNAGETPTQLKIDVREGFIQEEGSPKKPPTIKRKSDAKETPNGEDETEETQTPISMKKLKGSLSIKFKSYDWTKQDKAKKSTEAGEIFNSPDDEEKNADPGPKQEPLIVEQNNVKFQKCLNCMLYIRQDDFDNHKETTCEALSGGDGKEYICSECLVVYNSQKLLVRHKRECPRKNSAVTSKSKDLEGMYSVVWKCHCKKNFPSADELKKHRESCSSAQLYTATCPICNIRILGGNRTLRYHMAQNHADLFLPDESSSSSILSSLEGGQPMQVIKTQTSNVQNLVAEFSRRHSGANIRVVTLPKGHTSPTKAVDKRNASDGKNEEQESPAKEGSSPDSTRTSTRQKLREQAKKKAETEETDQPPKKKTAKGKAHAADETEGTEKGEGEKTGKEKQDLHNLLRKAKALTKELEEKLANSESDNAGADNQEDSSAEPRQARKRRKPAKLRDSDEEGNAKSQKKTARARASTPKPTKQIQDDPSRLTLKSISMVPSPEDQTATEVDGESNIIKKPRRYSRVTCLDCQTPFADYIQLGLHKRMECPALGGQGAAAQQVESLSSIETGTTCTISGSGIQKLNTGQCYFCTVCTLKFRLRAQLYLHMRNDHEEDGHDRYLNYHCPFCPRVFQTSGLCQEHKTGRHPDLKISAEDEFLLKDTVTCPTCQHITTQTNLGKHKCPLESEETEHPFFCHLCGVTFEADVELKVHRQKEHLNAIHFRCAECTRTFGHAIELRCHKASSHAKSLRMEEMMQDIRRQDAKQKLSKKFKVQIASGDPSTPKEGAIQEATTKAPAVENKPKSKPETPTEAPAPQEKASPTQTPKKVPSSIRVGSRSLALTKDQMQALAKGQPIKLALPKDADMKNISFSIKSSAGNTKRYSLASKTPESGDGSQPQQNGDNLSPRRELAAALGLKPANPDDPAPAIPQHRPTRLRSGRTIDSTSTDDQPTDKTETLQPPEPDTHLVDTPAEIEITQPDPGFVEQETEVITTPSVVILESDRSVIEEQPVYEEEVIQEGEYIADISDGSINKSFQSVQVLKPVGMDKVQCMRCNKVLDSMMQVASHECEAEGQLIGKDP